MSANWYLAGTCVLILVCLGMAAEAWRNLRRLDREERDQERHSLGMALRAGRAVR